jgi:hypothetical protein
MDGETPDGPGGGDGGCSSPPAAAGETTTSVAGMWSFTPSGGSATTIAVPGGGWVAQGFNNVNEATYQQTLMIPNLGRPQATYLEFGAINHQATLTVDGTMVATNTTSFTPSVFDVTSFVTPGMSHQFSIDVKGRNALKSSSGKKIVPDAAGWSPNVAQGIFRSAVLHVLPALHVEDTLVRTDVANDQISVDVWVKNDGATAADGTVSIALSSWTCDAFQYPALPSVPVSVPAGMDAKVTVGPVKWGLGPSSYWWPNVPYTQGYRTKLHVAGITVTPDAAGGGATAAHTLPVRFGFRQTQQVGAYYELNGVRVNYRGDDIQGADYDSINNTGKGRGDSYDLFAGFLPPSANNLGWPGAVDNWQKLNYNVSRLHQEPVTPYMLDVLDEMGFMAIEESAIRGSNNDQDFVNGLANMLGHLNALIHRDRNHPSIIRWSQDNEPEGDNTNSQMFQQQLYQTATAADDTRPVSADPSLGAANAANLNGYFSQPNFTVMEHYPSGFGDYTSHVDTTTARPFGVGEFIWSADNTRQGLVWFATSTMSMRQQDASDLRPYTLLSGWASFVPGVKSNMMTIEQGGPPLFDEDKLPDPWSSPILQRIQMGFSPVAVADVAYWDANHESDTQGDWPVSMTMVTKGSTLSRQLVVFNDTFSGTSVNVSWEMHQDSATGMMVDQGMTTLNIPLGSRTNTTIMVKAPSSGSTGVLILQSSKNGSVVFHDEGEVFLLQ